MIPTAKPTASNNELPKPHGFSRSWHRWYHPQEDIAAEDGGGNPITDGIAGRVSCLLLPTHPHPSLCVWIVKATRQGLSMSTDTESAHRTPDVMYAPPSCKRAPSSDIPKDPNWNRSGLGEGPPTARLWEIVGFPAANLCFPGNMHTAQLPELRCPVTFGLPISTQFQVSCGPLPK